MGAAPLVSIIVDSYNYGRFLREAIDSALGQTYPRTEVIVVDDGSTDHSRAIMAEYRDRIIPVLKENGGQASAFNAGFAASRGDVICFLDSDDSLFPDAMHEAVRLFRDGGGDLAKVQWPLQIVDEHGRKTGRVAPVHALSEGDLRQAVAHGGPGGYTWPPTSGNAWARAFLQTVFPIPEAPYRTCPDLYLCTLAPLFGAVRRVLQPQGVWRVHGSNNSWREPFARRIENELRRWEHCFGAARRYGRRMGVDVDLERWKRLSWIHRIHRAAQELAALVPPAGTVILVDEDQWVAGAAVYGRPRRHFLERDGQYWGPPPDDATAIRELERLRAAGARHIVFAWPAFWWLEHYAGLHGHLCSRYRRVLGNSRVIVFDLSR
jgi:glycosyltransferase involved in cell wall biosynthesis